MVRNFNAVPKFGSVDTADRASEAKHQAGHRPESDTKFDISELHKLEQANDGTEEKNLNHDPDLKSLKNPHDRTAAWQAMPEEEGDTKIEETGEEDEWEDNYKES
ncbi:MAG: hypothetical protein ACJAT3_001138, partial [Akkermansiaceae bacterium]